jgi:hypothetical protein
LIDLTNKDAELLRALWPWGAMCFVSLSGLLLLSWVLAGAGFAGAGNLFFVLLVIPFAWVGIGEYSRKLVARRMSVRWARLIGFVYLSILTTKFLLAFGEKGDWLPLLVAAQISSVGYAWGKYSAGPSFANQQFSFDTKAQYLWLEDALFLSLMLAFVVIL